RRIGHDRDPLDRGEMQHEVEDRLDGPRPPRAEIVDLTGLPALEQEPVPAHDVAHVGVVAARSQVTDIDYRLPQAGLDLRHWPGEVRRGEHVRARGPLVIEGPRADDRESVALEV